MEYYSIEDFKKLEKVDAHTHINTSKEAILRQAIEDNFSLITINVDAFEDNSIEEQQEWALAQHEKFPDRFYYLTTFRAGGFEEKGWKDSVMSYLKRSIANGAVGVKVWKNIGMDIRKSNGKLIDIDDPVFDPVFSFLSNRNIPLTGHIGEPRNCWLPIDEMVVPGDQNYYSRHPEYHMYLHPDQPPYEHHVQARDHMLEKNPGLVFVGAHLGSLEWSVDELAKRLDAYPLMSVDLAERICHLQYQSLKNWQKVYDFVIGYQDRLLYGTDIIVQEEDDSESVKQNAHEIWKRDWRYFNTDEEMSSPRVSQRFRGLKLPKDVVDKIYSKNAKRIYLKNCAESKQR